jgi:hypothetical protein
MGPQRSYFVRGHTATLVLRTVVPNCEADDDTYDGVGHNADAEKA